MNMPADNRRRGRWGGSLIRRAGPVALLFFGLLFFGAAAAGCGTYGEGGSDADPGTAAEKGSVSRNESASADRGRAPAGGGLDPGAPDEPVKLVFVHHSVGEDWLDDSKGGLAAALQENNYFVSDTNYGWGPADSDTGDGTIGDHTDIGHWYNWFAGDNSDTYMRALYSEDGMNTGSGYSRLGEEPDGENEIVMIKSCFTNSPLGGSPDDPPSAGQNLLRGQATGEEVHTVQNAKGIYNDLLEYFETEPDKLFIIVTAPPNVEGEASPQQAANARELSRWLAQEWLDDYPYRNVAVFDFYNVLTSNAGSPEDSDRGAESGNHHRYDDGSGTIEYLTGDGGDFAAYGAGGDSHPTAAGLTKATDEFTELLNIWYHSWRAERD